MNGIPDVLPPCADDSSDVDCVLDSNSLQEQRLAVVLDWLQQHNARSVLDLGCGSGDLLAYLDDLSQLEHIVGIDVREDALAHARYSLSQSIGAGDGRIELVHGSFTDATLLLQGFDAGVMLETIEHVDPGQLSLVERAVFDSYRPTHVLVTTPNREYNVLHGLPLGAFRHPDHQFEWDRSQFRRWALGVASRNGYSVRFDDIGPRDVLFGAPTQSAAFRITTSP